MVLDYIAPNIVKELPGELVVVCTYIQYICTYIHTVAFIHTDNIYIVMKCCHLEEQKKQREQSVGYVEATCHLLTFIYNVTRHNLRN